MSSTTQDPPDSVLLVILGESIMSSVVGTCTSILIYGVFILLFSQAAVTYIKKKQQSRAQHWMFIASATAFIMSTINVAGQLAATGSLIHGGLVGYPDLSQSEKRPLINAQLIKFDILLQWTTTFEMIMSDGIVVWRVIVLLQDRKWLKGFPSMLLLASSALYLVFLIFYSADANLAFEPGNSLNRLDMAGAILSLATNAVATALIGWIYWLHRRDMLTGLGKHQPTQAESILSLLVESGIVFLLFQATDFILGFNFQSEHASTAGSYALQVFVQIYCGFTAIYPTVVIALVNSHHTIDHMYSQDISLPRISHGSNLQHSTSIQFAQPDHATNAGTISQQVEKSQDVQGV